MLWKIVSKETTFKGGEYRTRGTSLRTKYSTSGSTSAHAGFAIFGMLYKGDYGVCPNKLDCKASISSTMMVVAGEICVAVETILGWE